MTAQEVLTALLAGGGAATLIATVGKTWAALQVGAHARETGALADCQAARHAAEVHADEETRRADFWHRIAAGYLFQLRSAGVAPDPADPQYRDDSP